MLRYKSKRQRFKIHWYTKTKLSFHVSLFAILFIVPAISIGLLYVTTRPNYNFNNQTKNLVGAVDTKLTNKLVFTNNTYVLKSNSSQKSSVPNIQISNSNYDPLSYGTKIPRILSQGIKVQDNKSNLSFRLIPQFGTYPAKEVKSHFVYPLLSNRQNQAIYTIRSDGVKEDLIINKPAGNKLSFSYKLKLPSDLAAKAMPNGAIGIYSASSVLFGHISYGSQSDMQKVQEARQKSPKNNLVFELLPPVVKETNGQKGGKIAGKARFRLNGNNITIAASDLANLNYPITIDPSILVNSAYNFNLGNNQGGVSLNGTGSSVTNANLTGGGIDSGWTNSSANYLPSGSFGPASVNYDGFIYSIGDGSNDNAVNFSQINSNGSLVSPGVGTCTGAWCSTTSIPISSNTQISAVTYNGYIYIASSALSTSNIYYAKINSNGSLGSWTADSNSYGNTSEGVNIDAYNGYLYVLAGQNGCSFYNSVRYARINSDGSTSTWTTSSNSFSTARSLAASVIYNGFIYIWGGQYINTANGGSSCSGEYQTLNDIQYAPIQSNGDVGAWSSIGTIPTTTIDSSYSCSGQQVGTDAMDYGVYDGYLYSIGGLGEASCTNVTPYQAYGTNDNVFSLASINANGTINPWEQSTSLAQSIYDNNNGATIYNNYIYLVGGYYNNSTNSPDVQYAQIAPAGALPNPITTTSLNTAVYSAATATYNGYIYTITGDNNGASSGAVQYAKINSNGTLGSWTTSSNTIGTAVSGAGIVIYYGHILIFGGTNGVAQGTISESTIGTGGAPGKFSSANIGMPTGEALMGVGQYNGYVYLVGGGQQNLLSLVAVPNVYYDTISSSGTLGSSWTAATSLSTAEEAPGVTIYDGYIYVIGGDSSGSGSYNNLVQYTAICTGQNTNLGCTTSSAYGSIGTWQVLSANNYPASMYGIGVASNNGYIYALGGYNGSSMSSNIYYSVIATDGSLSAPPGASGCSGVWCPSSSLPSGESGMGVVINNGYLYSIGGATAANTSTVNNYIFAINNGGGGGLSSVNLTSAFTKGRNLAATVAYNGYLYLLGGVAGSGNSGNDCTTGTYMYCNGVQYAPINANGSLGTWVYTTSFSGPRGGLAAVAYNGYMYILGGYNGSSSLNDVQYAIINSNGTLGSWNYTYNSANNGTTFSGGFTNAREGEGAVVYNGKLYLFGGEGSTYYSDVQYASINNNGTIGSWTTDSNSMYIDVAYFGFTEYNGYIYAVGGVNANYYYQLVQYAKINSNGSVGQWNYTTSVYENARVYNSAVAYNGYLYVIGGDNDSSTNYSDIQYAPINSDGTLGNWQYTTPINTSYNAGNGLSATVFKGYLYILGGNSGSTYYNDTTYYPIQSIARVGHYSISIDMGNGVDVTPVELMYYGQALGNPLIGGLSGTGGISIQYSYASTSCTTFNNPTRINGSQFDLLYKIAMTADGCGNSDAVAQYAQLYFTLNDSLTTTFPDIYSNHSSITSLKIYYHPNTSMRLRGGATFNNGSLQSLDTTP